MRRLTTQVNELIAKIVRPLIAALSLVLVTSSAIAQHKSSHGRDALQFYYSDLNQALLQYSLGDVPFEREQIKVARGESLLDISRKYRFRELDFYHLAAALYEINGQAFSDGDASRLKIGATINLPSVGDLINAQPRYENLKVVGDDIDFNNADNQMRKALRWPFGKSLVMIGPNARDELPANQEVTLTSYRPEAIAGAISNSESGFLSSATNASTGNPASSAAQSAEPETYGKWLDQTEITTPIARTFPIDSTNSQNNVELDDLLADDKSIDVPMTEVADAVADAVAEAEATALYSSESIFESEAVEVSNTLEAAAPAVVPETETPAVVQTEPVVEQPAAEPVQTEEAVASVQTNDDTVPAPEAVEPEAVEPEAVVQAAVVPKAETVSSELIAESQVSEQPIVYVPEDTDADAKDIQAAEPETTAEPKAVVAAAPVSKSEIVRDANLSTLDADSGFYLGAPRGNSATAPNDVPSDPLNYPVEWNFDNTASVGTVLNQLAEYIGYELVSDDNMVLSAYTRRLPGLQLRISGVTAEEGFEILAGRGLVTVFDHVERSVKHVPKGSRKPVPQVSAASSPEAHKAFIEKSGISAFLKEFPADMKNAALRHANRCESTAATIAPDVDRLYNVVVSNLQKTVTEAEANALVQWYNSPTGKKVLALERADINDAELQEFTVDASRARLVEQIYNGTVTGKGVASIAIELDYSGWTLSGCRHQAESTGDADQLNKEVAYGEGIKGKITKLESILRDDMVRSMAYLFSSLSDQELFEYADVTRENARLFTDLQQSIISAIERETSQITVSSLHE